MIRVLQVTGGMNRAGLETFIMNVYRKIDRTKIQFDFLIFKEKADYREEIEGMGGHLYVIPSRRYKFVAYNKNLEQFFSKHAHEYNAVHLHSPSLSSIEPLIIAKKYNIPIRIIHSHSSNHYGLFHHILHYCNKFVINKFANVFFACSDSSFHWMYDYTRVKHLAEVVNNGVDLDLFGYCEKKRIIQRERLGINKETILLGHVGRFTKVKNHNFLIDVFSELVKINDNYKLALIGTGDLKDEIKFKIEKMGLTKYVFLLGVRNDIYDLMQAMDAFIMPSFYEGFPVTLVEAQSSGLTVFCSDTISEMCKMTDNYYMLSLYDSPKMWAEFINENIKLTNRSDSRQIIKKLGFDISQVAEKLSKIYLGQY